MIKPVVALSRWLAPLLLAFSQSVVAALTASPAALNLTPGTKASVTLSGSSGSLSLSNSNKDVVEAEISDGRLKTVGKRIGTATLTVRDRVSRVTIPVTVSSTTGGSGGGTTGASFALLAWNDLGMHCMDGDYSVFSILPPFNNLHAQLVDSGNNRLVTRNVTLTFEAMADAAGSVNSISSTKTNFWQYAKDFFGADLPEGVGLTGYGTASFTPQALVPDAASGQFVAEGIPITPIDDAGIRNAYPMVKVVARDAAGNPIAQARVVLPVSDEMSCAACHASGTGQATTKPKAGWANDAHAERDYKKNILRLHDDKHLTQWTYKLALKQKGYDLTGLAATADKGKAILCAGCHASNALPGTGVSGIKPLTEAIHKHHGLVKDASGQLLDSSNNRDACYQCHPGSHTQCLRGVMGSATLADGSAAMQCQSCHGNMSNVGRTGRVGWLEQPNCQACHHDGKRDLTAVSATGILRTWLDTRYATNANAPASGFSLYRFSKGHGNLQCEACHGATHAIYPSSHASDNVLSMDLQGRAGSVGECAACHKNVPLTADKGPHGMHTIGSAWVDKHGDYAERGTQACAYCHGADYRGGILSTAKTARSFSAEGRTVRYAAGQKVGCYDCHNGPRGD